MEYFPYESAINLVHCKVGLFIVYVLILYLLQSDTPTCLGACSYVFLQTISEWINMLQRSKEGGRLTVFDCKGSADRSPIKKKTKQQTAFQQDICLITSAGIDVVLRLFVLPFSLSFGMMAN